MNDSLELLYPELVTDNTKPAFSRGSYFAGHTYTVSVRASVYRITGIVNMDEQSFIYADNPPWSLDTRKS